MAGTVTVEMLGTAGGPEGTYLMGKTYELPEEMAKRFMTPNPVTGFVGAKLVRARDITEDTEVRTEPETDTEDPGKGTKKKKNGT